MSIDSCLCFQNKAARSKVYHHFRPKTGHLGINQNCSWQNSGEQYPVSWINFKSFHYHVHFTMAIMRQNTADIIIIKRQCYFSRLVLHGATQMMSKQSFATAFLFSPLPEMTSHLAWRCGGRNITRRRRRREEAEEDGREGEDAVSAAATPALMW